MNHIFLFILIVFGTFPIMVKSQYIKLEGKQFIDENGDPFFPMIMNYSADMVYNGTVPSSLTTSNIKVVRSHDYGTQKWTFENNYTWADCETSLGHDFTKIAEMGFNAIRLILTPRKEPNGGGFYMKIRDFTNFHYATNFIMDPANAYTDNNSDVIFDKISMVIDIAASKGLKVILLCANAPEDEIAPDRGSNAVAAGEYAVFLAALADHLKYKSNLLAYDIYNEPPYQHTHGMVWDKHTICDFTTQWCGAIRGADENHLITMGSANVFDVFNWDQSIMPLDFMSMHFYPELQAWEGFDKVKATYRVLNQIYWCTQAMQRPWIIGETGFWATPETCFVAPAVDGTLSDQSNYVDDVLTALRDCGASGFSWWEFMDHHWYCWSPGDTCAVNSPPCWVCQDPYEVANYQRTADKIMAFHGLLNYSDPDLVNGDLNKGFYNAASEKPAVNTIRLFDENNISICDLPKDDNNEYFNPYDHPSHPNQISGVVSDYNTGEFIEFAMVKAKTIVGIDNLGDFIEHWHYTFTNSDGEFTINPYDYLIGNLPDDNLINHIKIGAVGAGTISSNSAYSLNSSINLVRDFFPFDEVISSLTVYNGTSKELRGYYTLSTSGLVEFQNGSLVEMTARKEIHLEEIFHASTGSDVHIFTDPTMFHECNDFTGFRELPLHTSLHSSDLNPSLDIELNFTKSQTHFQVDVNPNPGSGQFQVLVFGTEDLDVVIKLYNATGSLLLEENVLSDTYLMNIDSYPSGIYILIVQNTSGETSINKIVKY